jgi:glutamyl-tRNA synthetase
VILRIEDLDATRVRAEAKEGAIADLRWLGLDWDEGPFVQSERMEVYESALERLKQAELVYPCTCTRADIQRATSAPHAEDEGPVYPGTCARRSAAAGSSLDRPFAWRFRVPAGEVEWLDLCRGPLAVDPSRVGGDFVVGRSNAGPAYQLAVVADDALMGITQVIRGDDLIPSTPRQVLLYRALGDGGPEFGHVPLAIGPDGRRLAKREGSIKLATLRERGADPRRLVGWLVQSFGGEAEVRAGWPRDWIGRVDLASITKALWVVTPEGLSRLT